MKENQTHNRIGRAEQGMVLKAVGNRKLYTFSAVLLITSIAHAKSVSSAYPDDLEQEGAF